MAILVIGIIFSGYAYAQSGDTNITMCHIVESLLAVLVIIIVSLFISHDKIKGAIKKAFSQSTGEKKWWEEDGIIFIPIEYHGLSGNEMILNMEIEDDYKVRGEALDIISEIKPKNHYRATLAVMKASEFIKERRSIRAIKKITEADDLSDVWDEMAYCLFKAISERDLKRMGLKEIILTNASRDSLLTFGNYHEKKVIITKGKDEIIDKRTGIAFLYEMNFI